MLTEDEFAAETKKFSKIYMKGGASKIACDSIDFLAKKNSITGILGPNGAGKTTLLKTICGVIFPTSGEIKVAGLTEPDEIRTAVSFVPEVPVLDNNLTVEETIAFEFLLNKIKPDAAKIKSIAQKFFLEEEMNTKSSHLSKGYRQRLSLAKAVCKNPEVIVLDEFSGGLDPLQSSAIKKELKSISKNCSVIFSTHHIDEAVSLCEKIYVMNKGKIVASGSVGEVTEFAGADNLVEAFEKLTLGF